MAFRFTGRDLKTTTLCYSLLIVIGVISWIVFLLGLNYVWPAGETLPEMIKIIVSGLLATGMVFMLAKRDVLLGTWQITIGIDVITVNYNANSQRFLFTEIDKVMLTENVIMFYSRARFYQITSSWFGQSDDFKQCSQLILSRFIEEKFIRSDLKQSGKIILTRAERS